MHGHGIQPAKITCGVHDGVDLVGWQMASHMRTSLVTGALGMAIAHGRVAPNAVSMPIAAVITPRQIS